MPTLPRHSLEDLLRIMARLRAPDGCPWDKEQTHASILSCLIEESYEFVDAVERHDVPNMAEELGDLLLQVVFHSQMAQEAGLFNFADVVQGISEKLIRRHPHVFGEAQVSTSEAVVIQWDQIKAGEKAAAEKAKAKTSLADSTDLTEARESLLGQIPRQLPPLQKAEKIQKRAAKHGFDWPDLVGPLAKVHEELNEFEVELRQLQATGALGGASLTPSRAMAGEHPTPEVLRERLSGEFGDLLFSMINLGRRLEIDSERALSSTNQKFMRRFAAMETLIHQDGQSFAELTLVEMDRYWEQVKASEKSGKCF